jgi:hypothetical protein
VPLKEVATLAHLEPKPSTASHKSKPRRFAFRLLAVAGAFTLALAGTSCDVFPLLSAVGVRNPSTSSLEIEIVYIPCNEIHAKTVQLWDSRGPVVGDDDDDLLWEITTDGDNRTRFILGQVPPNFREAVPLEVSQLRSSSLVVTVINAAGNTSNTSSFAIDNLRQRQLFSEGKFWEEEAFRAEMQRRCSVR